MLPVYSQTHTTWYGTTHYVSIKKIEGDIWVSFINFNFFIWHEIKLKLKVREGYLCEKQELEKSLTEKF